MRLRLSLLSFLGSALIAGATSATPFFFSTNGPDGAMGMASRPNAGGKTEIEAADDFILTSPMQINGASFTGLITGANPTINAVDVEIYRVFPLDSDTLRTPSVPTRNNSPSDVAFDSRASAMATLSFNTSVINANFTANNSVLNGINKSPNQTTGGEGSISGQEVQFSVSFTIPYVLTPDHYFFIPQVQVTGGEFFWLSSSRPITTGTPFSPDLQAWIRNDALDPDWLRVGTDIVGGTTPPTFNGTFSLAGSVVVVPLPSGVGPGFVGLGIAISAAAVIRRRARHSPT